MMPQRKFWRLRSSRGQFIVLRNRDLSLKEVPLPPQAAWRVIERVLDTPHDASDLGILAAALSSGEAPCSHHLTRSALQKAILSGSLVLLEDGSEPPQIGNSIGNLESVADQLLNARPIKTWVEIELVDMAGEPMPNQHYICMLPDGNMLEGQLDDKGRVRFDGIDPGNCIVAFPDIDRDAWERVQ